MFARVAMDMLKITSMLSVAFQNVIHHVKTEFVVDRTYVSVTRASERSKELKSASKLEDYDVNIFFDVVNKNARDFKFSWNFYLRINRIL